MGEFDPIPRHDPPFTKEQIAAHLASARNWFDTGTTLHHAAGVLLDDLKVVPDRHSVFVGKPVAANISDEHDRRREREIVPAMLFAMAVECWLKGFVVSMMPRESIETRKEWGAFLHVDISPEDMDNNYLEKLYDSFEKEESKKLESKLEQQQQKENKQGADAVREHRHHDLKDLARATGMLPLLKEHDLEYLEFLSSAIVSGRYPIAFHPEQVIPWEGIASERARWDSLNNAIKARHDQLIRGEGEPEEDVESSSE